MQQRDDGSFDASESERERKRKQNKKKKKKISDYTLHTQQLSNVHFYTKHTYTLCLYM